MAVRVLWVVKGLGPGGAETLLAAQAAAHDRTRFHVECGYVLPWKDHLAGRLEAAGVTTHCVSRRRRDRLWPIRLARLVRSGGWHVIHVHSPLPGSVARIAARTMRRSRRPQLITTEHNAWGTFAWPTRLANRLTVAGDAAVFAVSEETRRSMRGRARHRATALAHGIDVAAAASLANEREQVRKELGIGADEFLIGTVANFRPQKDYPNLLTAVSIVAAQRKNVRWVVVGQGPLETETRELATRLGLVERVLFTGFRPDATRVMAAFDLFTLASSWEGLPVALMEALALGSPVVATAVGGVAEEMRDKVDALLVPPADPEALAAAWSRVIDDNDLRVRLGAEASLAASHFDVARAQTVVEEAYATLADQAGIPTPAEPTSPQRRSRAPLATEVEIRRAEPDDRPQILGLMRASLGWGDDSRHEELFAWKHDHNPFGPSPTWVAVHDGCVVAVRAFMRWQFRRGDEVLQAVRAVDTATHPDHQGRGLFTALTLRGVEELTAQGVDFVFNTPNDQSRPGYLKMGWREVGHLPAAFRLRSPLAIPTVLRARVPAERSSEVLDIGEPAAGWFAAREVAIDAPTDVRAVVTDVSSDFLRWRFGLAHLYYRVIEGDGGAVVVRARRRGPALELVQVASLGLRPRDADAVVARALVSSSAHYAVRLGERDLCLGFLPVPGGGPLLTWRSLATAGLPPLPNWQLTMGDVELF